MSLALHDNIREKIAVDLLAFFEPHDTKPHQFDEWCGWCPGSTAELLEKRRGPTDAELLEICLRLNHPLSLYIRTAEPDGTATDPHLPWTKCTKENPCCRHRLQYNPGDGVGQEFACPADCLCHT